MSDSHHESVRKHLYLIIEHEDEELVGRVMFTETRFSNTLKNQAGPIQALDESKQGFSVVGKRVGLGYHDFESPEAAQDPDRAKEVIDKKLAEIDPEYIDKAGHDPEDYQGATA